MLVGLGFLLGSSLMLMFFCLIVYVVLTVIQCSALLPFLMLNSELGDHLLPSIILRQSWSLAAQKLDWLRRTEKPRQGRSKELQWSRGSFQDVGNIYLIGALETFLKGNGCCEGVHVGSKINLYNNNALPGDRRREKKYIPGCLGTTIWQWKHPSNFKHHKALTYAQQLLNTSQAQRFSQASQKAISVERERKLKIGHREMHLAGQHLQNAPTTVRWSQWAYLAGLF